ncbi:MAG: hypothetical protein IJZ79_04130, partial [Bacilli bacterium]|nr:hypothetical protein [Bacilli bacterium]
MSNLNNNYAVGSVYNFANGCSGTVSSVSEEGYNIVINNYPVPRDNGVVDYQNVEVIVPFSGITANTPFVYAMPAGKEYYDAVSGVASSSFDGVIIRCPQDYKRNGNSDPGDAGLGGADLLQSFVGEAYKDNPITVVSSSVQSLGGIDLTGELIQRGVKIKQLHLVSYGNYSKEHMAELDGDLTTIAGSDVTVTVDADSISSMKSGGGLLISTLNSKGKETYFCGVSGGDDGSSFGYVIESASGKSNKGIFRIDIYRNGEVVSGYNINDYNNKNYVTIQDSSGNPLQVKIVKDLSGNIVGGLLYDEHGKITTEYVYDSEKGTYAIGKLGVSEFISNTEEVLNEENMETTENTNEETENKDNSESSGTSNDTVSVEYSFVESNLDSLLSINKSCNILSVKNVTNNTGGSSTFTIANEYFNNYADTSKNFLLELNNAYNGILNMAKSMYNLDANLANSIGIFGNNKQLKAVLNIDLKGINDFYDKLPVINADFSSLGGNIKISSEMLRNALSDKNIIVSSINQDI